MADCRRLGEAAVFQQRCGASIPAFKAASLANRHVRGLSIVWRMRRGQSNQLGTGTLLLAACRLHALCMRLERYCYIKLYDAPLEQFFSYAHGGTWQLTRAEVRKYQNSKHLELNATKPYSNSFEHILERRLANDTAALLRVTAWGVLPLYPSTSWPSQLSMWQTISRPPDVDPCLCRYVTAPVAGSTVGPIAAQRAIHMRTSFADVDPSLIQLIGPSQSDARAWLGGACGSFQAAVPLLLLSDSVGLVRHLCALHPQLACAATPLAAVTKYQGASSAVEPNRWSRAAQRSALSDLLAAGSGPSTLEVAPMGSFDMLKPAAQQWRLHASTFAIGAYARSVCLNRVSLGVAECPNYASVFIRGLPDVWAKSAAAPRNASDGGMARRIEPTDSAEAVEQSVRAWPGQEARIEARFAALQASLHQQPRGSSHPCYRRTRAECMRSFVAALASNAPV